VAEKGAIPRQSASDRQESPSLAPGIDRFPFQCTSNSYNKLLQIDSLSSAAIRLTILTSLAELNDQNETRIAAAPH
jgi:hypothetical protein